jgi:NADH-quinone oxidoreductase subunit A
MLENPLAHSFFPAAFMLAMAAMTGAGILLLSWFLGAGRTSHADETVYECGLDPAEAHEKRFPVKFYVVAMLFILFDVEVALLYPFAVFFGRPRADGEAAGLGFESTQGLRLFGLAEAVVFIGLLAIGYVYLYRGGAFDWHRPRRRTLADVSTARPVDGASGTRAVA